MPPPSTHFHTHTQAVTPSKKYSDNPSRKKCNFLQISVRTFRTFREAHDTTLFLCHGSVMKSIFTREELLSYIADWKGALQAAATGKSYAIGGRNLTRYDLPAIREQLKYYQDELNALDGHGSLIRRRALVVRR